MTNAEARAILTRLLLDYSEAHNHLEAVSKYGDEEALDAAVWRVEEIGMTLRRTADLICIFQQTDPHTQPLRG
jgi:hypothetical protein